MTAVSARNIAALISRFTDAAYPDPENPRKPGPWGPVIRAAAECMLPLLLLEHEGRHTSPQLEPWGWGLPVPWRGGPSPEPWSALFAAIAKRAPQVLDIPLGPHPEPWQTMFASAMASEFIKRASLMQEFADASEERGLIVIGGRVRKFVDDYCGNEFHLEWPFPGPRPHWFKSKLGAEDLAAMGARFHGAAAEAFSPALQEAFSAASVQFIETALGRMDRGGTTG